jgi:uncharacterized membrane protein YeaQ/YmgE (transglycosylase-associated protein family)
MTASSVVADHLLYAARVARGPRFGRRVFGDTRCVAVVLVILLLVLAVVLGVAILGLVLELLWWALIGLVIGALARLILPGIQPIGWLGTVVAGIAGALLGGIVADAFDFGGFLQFVVAVLTAAALIAAFAGGSRRAYA